MSLTTQNIYRPKRNWEYRSHRDTENLETRAVIWETVFSTEHSIYFCQEIQRRERHGSRKDISFRLTIPFQSRIRGEAPRTNRNLLLNGQPKSWQGTCPYIHARIDIASLVAKEVVLNYSKVRCLRLRRYISLDMVMELWARAAQLLRLCRERFTSAPRFISRHIETRFGNSVKWNSEHLLTKWAHNVV